MKRLVGRDEGKVVLWPQYFDSAEPRPLRRVARSVAVAGPTADEVAKAALALRMRPILEREIPHPAKPYDRRGRVLLDARGTKTILVRQVAEKLRELREGAAPGKP